jgi:uncharacterized protein
MPPPPPKNSFVLSASELDAGGKRFARPIPNAWLTASFEESDATPAGDGAVDVRLSKSGTDVVVHGRAKADIELPCSRCLETVKVALTAEISVLMVPAAKIKHDREHEMAPSEADVLPYDGDNVVLDDLLRDDLLLEIPMIPLCSEDCPGIASAHPKAEAKPVDPRLAPLLRLKKIQEKE